MADSPSTAQSVSPLAPIGVNAAIQAASEPEFKAKPKIFDEFALTDRVGIVSGGNRGLGLEMALALCEAGARAIYCFDLPTTPSDEWTKTSEYVKKLGNGSRLEYVSADVRDQKALWKKAEEIGDSEQRMDICVAAAGILKSHTDCLEYPAEQFKQVMSRESTRPLRNRLLTSLTSRFSTLTQMASFSPHKRPVGRYADLAEEVVSSS